MSSLGQWRGLRHYLSLANLNAEIEKVLHKLKTTENNGAISRFENAATSVVKPDNANKTEEPKTDSTEEQESILKEEITPEVKVKEIPVPLPTSSKVTPATTSPATSNVASDIKDISFKGILQGLVRKKDTHLGKISDPSWKTNKPTVTKSSIHARTAYVIGAVLSASDADSSLRRAERLVEHLHAYPEARDYAIKEGAVRALLRVQNSLSHGDVLHDQINGVVNEALALVGYCGPPRARGANILSLDGGGVRGLIAIEILRHLETLTGKKVHELFDYIIGVSTGAIIAAVIASGLGDLERAAYMYRTLSRDMFGGTSRIGGGARLVWTHSYYDTQAWEKLLKDNLRECTLAHCNRLNMPKLAIVSCVVNSGAKLSPYLFRSYSVGFKMRSVFPGSSKALLWEAVRASAAAPTYFDEFRLDGLLHQDGGILVNNPTGVGLHEARLLFGAEAVNNGTIVSVGTGRALAPLQNTHKDITSTSWKDKFDRILDSATDTEGVHVVLNDLLSSGHYYRLNPPLLANIAMDEIDPNKLDKLCGDTQAYIRRNRHKLREAANMLVRPRSVPQRVSDVITRHALLAGVALHQ